MQLWDNNDVFKKLFLIVENAAKGWDGTNPVRPGPGLAKSRRIRKYYGDL